MQVIITSEIVVNNEALLDAALDVMFAEIAERLALKPQDEE